MKKLIPIFATAVMFSASANAFNFYGDFAAGNDGELYPYNTDIHHKEIPLVVQPGTGDTYGGNVMHHNFLDGLRKDSSEGYRYYDNWQKDAYGDLISHDDDFHL